MEGKSKELQLAHRVDVSMQAAARCIFAFIESVLININNQRTISI